VSFLSANRTWQNTEWKFQGDETKKDKNYTEDLFFLFSYKDGFAGTSREEEGSNLIQDGGRG